MVKPWMKKQMEMFDKGKEAANAMGKTRVSAAAGLHQPSSTPQPVRIHTEFQLNEMQDYSKRCEWGSSHRRVSASRSIPRQQQLWGSASLGVVAKVCLPEGGGGGAGREQTSEPKTRARERGA